MIPDLHNDSELFLASLKFTSDETGFAANLIEKDYLCSVLLGSLTGLSDSSLIFKGGTCLAKVYFDFNRLSEDLDFIISTPVDAKRKERSARATPYKKAVTDIPKAQGIFRIKEPLEGKSESRQYLATLEYTSVLDGHDETIKLEIGLREPLLNKPINGQAGTILLNAANPGKKFAPIPFACLSLDEALAEKFRAALSRRDVAIRDFYDIDYSHLRKGMDFDKPDFIDMIRKKLVVPGNDPPNVSIERFAILRSQLDSRLKPVLRPQDYDAFDLDRAVEIVKGVHQKL